MLKVLRAVRGAIGPRSVYYKIISENAYIDKDQNMTRRKKIFFDETSIASMSSHPIA